MSDLEIEIIDLYDNKKMSVADIVIETGLSGTFIRKTLDKAGVFRPGRDRPGWVTGAVDKARKSAEKMYARYKKGERLVDLAAELGISRSSLYKGLVQEGFEISPFAYRRMGKIAITPEKFIEVWQQAQSLDEVCDALGLRKAQASARATAYRKKGVELQSFDGKRRPQRDWDELAKFADLFDEADPQGYFTPGITPLNPGTPDR